MGLGDYEVKVEEGEKAKLEDGKVRNEKGKLMLGCCKNSQL